MIPEGTLNPYMGRYGVVVLGMPRSGTSLTASILEGHGVHFGSSSSQFSPDEHNQFGYWEHRDLTRILRQYELSLILNNLGVLPLPKNWLDYPETEGFIERYQQALDQLSKESSLWGLKDPDLSWQLSFLEQSWDDSFGKPIAITCVRNPFEVAASQKARFGWKESQTLLSWTRHTLSALSPSWIATRFVVPFSMLFEKPKAAVEPILQALSLEYREESTNIRSDHRHHSLSWNHGTIPSFLSSPIQLIETITNDTIGYHEGKYDTDLQAELTKFDEICTFLNPDPPTAFLRSADWSKRLHPSREWQAIAIDVPRGESEIELQLWQYPGVVWIRNPEWVKGGKARFAQLRSGRESICTEHGAHLKVATSAGASQLIARVPPAGADSLRFEALYLFNSFTAALHSQAVLRLLDSIR